ncbi:lipopolysaccharide biosynthesis protein [Piscinibacter aquaticus]|uniref:Lipopolysaccharide biosynthesis protein n=1 Tax=Piscinibacter aquaticus TaxID=392597 RepID=A0A5C6U350_9BURK|nr:lipopolysaccharide biosynthesis protein [Piscinibacter aquaticus]
MPAGNGCTAHHGMATTGFSKHLSYYTLASVLVTLASVVSFPLLTRLLSVEEYGVMNLVSSALAILVGVAKLGLGNAALRFYSEVRAGKHGVDMNGYASTVVVGMGALGLVVTLGWLAATLLIPATWWNDPLVAPLMAFTSVLVLVRVLESALLNQIRAQELSGLLALFGVVRRYVGLAVIFGVLFWVSRDLWGSMRPPWSRRFWVCCGSASGCSAASRSDPPCSTGGCSVECWRSAFRWPATNSVRRFWRWVTATSSSHCSAPSLWACTSRPTTCATTSACWRCLHSPQPPCRPTRASGKSRAPRQPLTSCVASCTSTWPRRHSWSR